MSLCITYLQLFTYIHMAHMAYVYQIYNNCSNQHHVIMYDPALKNIPNDSDRPEFMGWLTCSAQKNATFDEDSGLHCMMLRF